MQRPRTLVGQVKTEPTNSATSAGFTRGGLGGLHDRMVIANLSIKRTFRHTLLHCSGCLPACRALLLLFLLLTNCYEGTRIVRCDVDNPSFAASRFHLRERLVLVGA